MFELRDPRFQGIAEAGKQFGTGLGDTLAQSVVNRQLSRALQGGGPGEGPITPETPVNDVMARFAKYNVSPEASERYFSPVLQQRAAQQHAMKLVDSAMQNPKSTVKDIVTAFTKANALTGGNMGDIKPLLDFYIGQKMGESGNVGNEPGMPGTSTPSPSGEQEVPQQKGMPQAQMTPPGSPMGQSQPSQMMNQPQGQPQGMTQGQPQTGAVTPQGVVKTGVSGSQAFEQVPTQTAVKPPTPLQKQQIRNQERIKWGKTTGDAEADRKIAEWTEAATNATAEQERERLGGADTLKRQEMIDQQIDSNFERRWPGGKGAPPPFMVEYAKQFARDNAKGTADQRAAQAMKRVDTITDRANTVSGKMPSTKFVGRSPEQQITLLERQNAYSKRFLDDFDDEQKKYGYDMLRSAYREKVGIGPIKAEYAINYPDKDVIKDVNGVGNIWDYAAKADKVEDAQKDLTGKLVKHLPNGVSPLIMKNLVVMGLGWDDSFFDNALADALKEMSSKGLAVPDYNEMALNDTYLKFKPSFPGESLTGQTLLGPLEFHR